MCNNQTTILVSNSGTIIYYNVGCPVNNDRCNIDGALNHVDGNIDTNNCDHQHCGAFNRLCYSFVEARVTIARMIWVTCLGIFGIIGWLWPLRMLQLLQCWKAPNWLGLSFYRLASLSSAPAHYDLQWGNQKSQVPTSWPSHAVDPACKHLQVRCSQQMTLPDNFLPPARQSWRW